MHYKSDDVKSEKRSTPLIYCLKTGLKIETGLKDYNTKLQTVGPVEDGSVFFSLPLLLLAGSLRVWTWICVRLLWDNALQILYT